MKTRRCFEIISRKTKISVTLLLVEMLLVVLLHNFFLVNEDYVNGKLFVPIGEEEKEERLTYIKNNPDYVMTDLESYEMGKNTIKSYIIDSDTQIENSFVSELKNLNVIRIRFINPNPESAKGTVVVSLKDEKGSVLGETSLPIEKIGNKRMTDFSFTGSTEYLNRNKILDFSAKEEEGKGIQAKGENLLLVMEVREYDGEKFAVSLSNDRQEDESQPQMYFVQRGDNVLVRQILLHMAIIICGILIMLRIDGMPKKQERLIQVLFISTPFFCTFLLRVLSGFDIGNAFEFLFSFLGFLNVVITAFFCWMFYAISNRKQVAITMSMLLCLVLGFANYFLLQFRDSPLFAADLLSINTALQVAKSYSISFNQWAVSVIVLSGCWLCITWGVKERKKEFRKKSYLLKIAIAGISGVLLFIVFFQSSFLRKNDIWISSFKPSDTYINNGYMLSFFGSATLLRVEKPSGYSVEKVREIVSWYDSDPGRTRGRVSDNNPNIIFVMNEAFSDIRENGNLPMNPENMPYYYSLRKNATTGRAYSSVFGGSTSVSEFEILTGFTMRFMPFSSSPYVSLMNSKVPNLTTTLNDLGYGGLEAFHPGARDSYNRNNAYPLLGFKHYKSLENVENSKYIRSYLSDKCDYEYVIELFEKHQNGPEADEPFYIFNVTIQNHGAYDNAAGEVDSGIEITEPSLNVDCFKNYLNLIKISDDELRSLHNYFDNVDEPTLVVIVGDHQPYFKDGKMDLLYEYNNIDIKDEKQMEEARENLYIVPFAIWANYDIEEKSNELISLNYLSSYVLDSVGAGMTGYNKYLLDIHKQLPVITSRMIIDKDGKKYKLDDKNPYEHLLKEYQMVQYNGFIDAKNRINEFFYLD